MAPSPLAEMPPRPWELGERARDDDGAEVGLELPWRRAGSPPGVSARRTKSSTAPVPPRDRASPAFEDELRVPGADVFLLFELLRRSAHALIALADRIDGEEPHLRARARMAATANVFMVLGALSSRGIFLPRVPGTDEVPDASMLLGAPDACRALGEEIERFLQTIGDGTAPSPAEMAPLLDRIEECWDHLSGERRDRGAP